VLIIFAMVGAGFVALLVDLQAVRPEELRSYGEDQRAGRRQLAGYRGKITDRDGFVLAVSTPSHRIEADPSMIIDPSTTASLLAPHLGIEAAELAGELVGESEGDRYALLARTVTEEAVLGIQQLRESSETKEAMIGIFVRPEEARIYPAAELATAIVGRVDPDEVGIYGVEQQYDDIMTGIPGEEAFERSRFGSISVTDWEVNPATAGYDVVLSIDHRLQFVTEEALKNQCEQTGAAGATAVLTDPATGEILAMAGVDRDDETGRCQVPIYNPALVTTFEPGSVLKTITMAAAIEEMGYTADTAIEVPPRVTVGGREFVDHPPHAGAPFPLSQILSDSMNVGTVLVAQQLGPSQVHAYLGRFGFGQATGIGFKGEATGTLRPIEDWYGSDAASVPIGYGITVNATQLAAAYNVVANGGEYRSPVLVRSLLAPDGTQYPVNPGPAKPVVSQATAAEVTDLLVGVVENGTGRSAAIPGFQVAGKTGTAWKLFEDSNGDWTYGEDGERRYVATFAGFVPAQQPRLSMVVVIDEPQGQFYASSVAAPVFSEVAQYALRILGVAPDQPSAAAGERVRGTPAPGPEQALSETSGASVGTSSATGTDQADESASIER
jgi:cell division protein FtsI (penicillin-binding protein 3)